MQPQPTVGDSKSRPALYLDGAPLMAGSDKNGQFILSMKMRPSCTGSGALAKLLQLARGAITPPATVTGSNVDYLTGASPLKLLARVRAYNSALICSALVARD